jgi:histone-lysine N-methyltransferase SETMAR
MTVYVPNKHHMREVLLFHFAIQKSAAETHRILVGAYGDNALSKAACKRWFARFGKGDFMLEDKERPRQRKVFEDQDLEALVAEDPCQTQTELAKSLNASQSAICRRLKAMGKVYKVGRWLPHELKVKDMERRKVTCEILLARQKRKSFLHRIITGDEKWIYFENPKRRKTICDPGQPSKAIPKRNIHGKKALLSIWWDQKGVIHHELLKQGETVTGHLYQDQIIRLSQALREKRPEYEKRQHKVILLHDNARPHVDKRVQERLELLRWEVLPHAPYSPDCAPSDFHLFRSMAHSLADIRFQSFEEVEKWVTDWIATKDADFFYLGIHQLPEKWQKVTSNDGNYFE